LKSKTNKVKMKDLV